MLTEKMIHQAAETRLHLEIKRLISVLQNKSDPVAYLMSQHRDINFVHELANKIAQRESLLNTTTIYDYNANIIASTHHDEHTPALIDRNSPAFVIPMHKRIFISSPMRLSDRHLEFLIAVPLIVGNKSIGALISTVNIDTLWRAVKAKVPKHSSNIYLIDGRGTLLTPLPDSKYQQGDLLSDREIVRSLLAGKAWRKPDLFEGLEGKKVFAIATLVQNLRWGIISEIPSVSIVSPVTSALITLILVVVMSHLLFGLIGLMFTTRLLHPVAELARVMKRATHGDYKHQLRPSHYREIDDLTVSFSAMVHEIEGRESALRKLSMAIEQAAESILITDGDGVIEYVNSAFTKITGYSANEAIGQTPRILKSGNQDAAFYAAMWKTIRSRETWNGKVINRKKDGCLFPAMLNIAPIMNAEGKITHYTSSHTDISKLENMEKRFHLAQKMEAIGTLVGGIAHNFNNMLAGITGNLYLVKKRVQDPDVLRRLDMIDEVSLSAAAMIKELLAFARKDMISMKTILLTPLFKETLKFLRLSVPENISLHQDICNDSLQIKGDVTQLHQVMMNLINNARDAVEGIDAPTITVRLEPFHTDNVFMEGHPHFTAGSYACLSVEDNGCGIPDSQREHLFEPFFTTKEQGKGTGLGLSMVFGAVKMHHGFVEVDSIEGKGTAFHIYIPLLEREEVASDSMREMGIVEGQGESILLVDDEGQVRETMAEVLESFGYRVQLAKDGLEAMEIFKTQQRKIALAILDVVMPNMGGIQLSREIRRMNPKIPVIFLTGYDSLHLPGGEKPIQNSTMLTKPVQFDDLNRLIRTLLD